MIRDIEKMEKALPIVKQEFIRLSLDYLEEGAKEYIKQTIGGSSWYVITHNLENSFRKSPDIGKLVNECWYSAFVEYGTGVVGEGTHEDPKTYQYDINNHGENGWWFYDEKGKAHWTKGMEAHRFMYRATVDYITIGYKEIFKKLFDKKIGVIFK